MNWARPLASMRGLCGGFLVALTLPLLAHAPSGAAGLGDAGRWLLGSLEIAGAVLFAFERSVVAGSVLLLTSFCGAAAIHLHAHAPPWHLLAYAAAVSGLWAATGRTSRHVAPGA